MKYETLKILGLSDEQTVVYIKLCEGGRQTLTEIARTVGMHRPRLYTLIPAMVKAGFLIEQNIGKRTHYRAVEPRLLYDQLQSRLGTFSEEVDALQGVFERRQQKPEISFSLGAQGYNHLFDDIADMVPRGGEICRYSARKMEEKNFHTSKKYRDRREKGHFDRLAITSESRAATKDKRLDRLMRVIPEAVDLFNDNVSMMVYEDRTALIDHDNESVFIVYSQKIAEFQRKLFKMLWKQLPEPKRYRD